VRVEAAAGCCTVVSRVVVVVCVVTGSSDAQEVSMMPATIENSEVMMVNFFIGLDSINDSSQVAIVDVLSAKFSQQLRDWHFAA
jgi:hypothetical protein